MNVEIRSEPAQFSEMGFPLQCDLLDKTVCNETNHKKAKSLKRMFFFHQK
jgi:hypothetical protein